jgi:hypothetical protein
MAVPCVCQGLIVYSFLGLIVNFVGGRRGAVASIEVFYKGDISDRKLSCCAVLDQRICPGRFCLFRTPLGYFRLLEFLVAQMMVVKPVINILDIIANAVAVHHGKALKPSPVHYTSICSLLVAYVALIRMYIILAPKLRPLRLVVPFLLLKGLILLVTLEATFFQYIAKTGRLDTPAAQNTDFLVSGLLLWTLAGVCSSSGGLASGGDGRVGACLPPRLRACYR